MRIAITGAHKVGKTTLAEALQEHLPDYEHRAEPYYELEELGYEFSERPTVDDFIEQLEYSIKQLGTNATNVVFDRCPIDFLAYINAIDSRINTQSYYERVEEIMASINLLIFVPIEEPDLIVYKDTDLPELRYRVNETITEWVGDFGVEVLTVSGALHNRLAQVLDKVKQS
ncbi:MAG: ATP-binding protein [Bacteroidetes bacterium]|nr:MAG: ATP-binding protein [Bacteroidota bacterium]